MRVDDALQIKIALLLFVIFGLMASNVEADNSCRALVLQNVAAIESAESILHKGEYDTEITEYVIDRHTRIASFCSYGGYCYPTHVLIGGKVVEALRLMDCKIGEHADVDADTSMQYVESMKPPSREEKLYGKLLGIGLCSACAGSVADFVISRSSSTCAILAKKALAGNLTAIKELQSFPDFCSNWESTPPSPSTESSSEPVAKQGDAAYSQVPQKADPPKLLRRSDAYNSQGSTSADPSAIEGKKLTGATNEKIVMVIAQALPPAVPGAIVCPDHNKVSLLFEMYRQGWEQRMQDMALQGSAAHPLSMPNPEALGCVLVPPGTPMTLEIGNSVPIVSVKLKDGTIYRGVTLPIMMHDADRNDGAERYYE